MESFQHINVEQLQQLIQTTNTLQLIDIRNAASFAAGHIAHSTNVNNDNITEFIHDADMDAPLIIVCYHGISSQHAALYLSEQGFDEIYSLDGGYQAWSAYDSTAI